MRYYWDLIAFFPFGFEYSIDLHITYYNCMIIDYAKVTNYYIQVNSQE